MKGGAYDYLTKPFELDDLGLTVERAFRTAELEGIEQVQTYRREKEIEEAVLVGGTGLDETMRLVELAAASESPVLITGETGTGKTLAAKAIHYRSKLASFPFISINCAALPENLIEAELFGYDKGAFTGAVTAKKGIFEMAEGGTLFLDEIGEMPLHLQSKLLSTIEEKTLKRLGSESFRRVNVRIIAATSVDLERSLGQTFRKDLYYRLSVIRIHLPPLRERRQDLAAAVRHPAQAHGLPACRAVRRRAAEADAVRLARKCPRTEEYPGTGRHPAARVGAQALAAARGLGRGSRCSPFRLRPLTVTVRFARFRIWKKVISSTRSRNCRVILRRRPKYSVSRYRHLRERSKNTA